MNKEKEQISSWSRKNHNLFETFALEIQEFTENGVLPAHADQDMRYCMELQRERCKRENIRMRYEFIPKGPFANDASTYGKKWSDDYYTSQMAFRTCDWKREFYQGEKRLFRKQGPYTFYQTTTTAKSFDVVGSQLYACPNCNGSSTLTTLREGCPYCGTHFKISELFPKVTTYYLLENMPFEKDMKNSICKVMLLVGMAFLVYSLLMGKQDLGVLRFLLEAVLPSVLGGVVLGYFIWSVATIAKIFYKAAESTPMLFHIAGSEKKFVSRMQQYSGEFSYEYFGNKAVSLLKMILFSKDATELPIYTGEALGDRFLNIMDASYVGGMSLKEFKVEGDYCRVKVGIYMENMYKIGQSIRKKKEMLVVTLQKNIAKPIDYNFSIRNIQCPSCNYSFDATKQKHCPGCGTAYEVAEEDWLVTSIE